MNKRYTQNESKKKEKKNERSDTGMAKAATTRTNDDDYDDGYNTFFMIELYVSLRDYNYVKW